MIKVSSLFDRVTSEICSPVDFRALAKNIMQSIKLVGSYKT